MNTRSPEYKGKFYAYVLRTPDGVPFYAGYGGEGRLRQVPSNPDVRRIVAELQEKGSTFERTIEEFFTENEAKRREMELIEHHGRTLDGGTLVNRTKLTRGGVHGKKMSEYLKSRFQEARSQPLTDEHRRRVSQGMVGIRRSPETIEKMRLAQKARRETERSIRGNQS